jgi:hypothetical protein
MSPRKIHLAPPIEPGEYADPVTGTRYTLYGFFGFTVAKQQDGHVMGFTGWPSNWKDLVPAEAVSS